MLLYIYTIFTISCFSMSDISSAETKALGLLNAKNLKELKHSTGHFEQLEMLKSMCEFEIKEKSLPGSCYEYVLLNNKTSRKKTFGTNNYNRQILKLDELCEESLMVKKLDKTPTHLSKLCKKIVERRNQELDYIQKEQNPYGYVISQ